MQYFRFSASPPLSLRTKVRSVGDAKYLEACLENAMAKPLVLDYIKFEPTEIYEVEPIELETNSTQAGPLTQYINSLQVCLLKAV